MVTSHILTIILDETNLGISATSYSLSLVMNDTTLTSTSGATQGEPCSANCHSKISVSCHPYLSNYIKAKEFPIKQHTLPCPGIRAFLYVLKKLFDSPYLVRICLIDSSFNSKKYFHMTLAINVLLNIYCRCWIIYHFLTSI